MVVDGLGCGCSGGGVCDSGDGCGIAVGVAGKVCAMVAVVDDVGVGVSGDGVGGGGSHEAVCYADP